LRELSDSIKDCDKRMDFPTIYLEELRHWNDYAQVKMTFIEIVTRFDSQAKGLEDWSSCQNPSFLKEHLVAKKIQNFINAYNTDKIELSKRCYNSELHLLFYFLRRGGGELYTAVVQKKSLDVRFIVHPFIVEGTKKARKISGFLNVITPSLMGILYKVMIRRSFVIQLILLIQ